MNEKILFSVIIPVYNGSKTIVRCLDSIFSQPVSRSSYEVICVDDCSTDDTVQTILDYRTARRLDGLKLVRHEVNKRQGGGRNTGVGIAKGEYVLYVDQDDYFLMEVLDKLAACLDGRNDIVTFDYVNASSSGDVKYGTYTETNSTDRMTGKQYMCTQQVPWSPWLYAYRRALLLDNRITFVEHTRFEDADYVIRCTVAAKSMQFVPLRVICHTSSDEQTTCVGNDVGKIRDLFWLSDRVKHIGVEESAKSCSCVAAVLGHHFYMHKYDIMRYLWRVPFKDMLQILKAYPAYVPCRPWWLSFSARHPLVFACGLQLLKPVLPLVRRMYLMGRG